MMRISSLSIALLAAAAGGDLLAQDGLRAAASDAAARVPGLSATSAVTGGDVVAPASSTVTLRPGFPVDLGVHPSYNFAPTRGVAFADLDRDGSPEIVRPSTNNTVQVIGIDGKPHKGWPQTTIGFPQWTPAVADLDGDGSLEIVVTTRGLTSGGRLYVFHADGKVASGFPVNLSGNNVSGSVAVGDLDGDGKLEIVACERAYPKGLVHVLRHDGKPFGGKWPVSIDHVPAVSPSIGDLDGDGKPEVVFASYNSLYVAAADGTLLKGWPYDVSTKHNANFSYQSPALGDLDGDGKLEIVTACHKSGSGVYAFRLDGTLLTGWPKSFGGTWSYSPPSVVDLDGDGNLDVVAGRAGGTASTATIYAWTGKGALMPGFPTNRAGGAEAPLAIADIDGDGVLEILSDTNVASNGQSAIHCVDAKGQVEPGFPVTMPGFTHMNGAQVIDVDGDGKLEFAAVSTWFATGNRFAKLWLYGVDNKQKAGKIEWSTYQQGNARRGVESEEDRLVLRGDARPGGKLRQVMRAEPGHVLYVLASLKPGLVPVPGASGFLRLDPTAGLTVFWTQPFVGVERAWLDLPLPSDPRLSGFSFAVQGLDVDPKTYRFAFRDMVPVTIR